MNQTDQKQYYQENKEKKRAYQRKYYQENKEKRLAYQNEYNKENQEKRLAYQREYNKKNSEKQNEWRRANPERVSEWRRKRYAKNPESILAVNRKYQHSKKNPDLTADKSEMVEHFYEQAARLNNIFGSQVFEVDHTTPLSKGGKHCPWNLQVVPAKWNRTKNNHHSGRWEVPFVK